MISAELLKDLQFEVNKANLIHLIECELARRGLPVYCGRIEVPTGKDENK